MEVFDDKKTGLLWTMPEYQINEEGDYVPTSLDDNYCKDIIEELNSWKSKNIREFLTNNNGDLGNLVFDLLNVSRKPFLAYEDGELVATALIEKSSLLPQYVTLKGYVTYCEEKHNGKGFKGCLDLNKAKELLDNATKSKHSSINILAVKGDCQGRGVGTRCIKSINDNIEFFGGTNEIISLNTSIHEDNVASIKAFERNGFRKPYRWYEDKYYQGFDSYLKLRGREK